MIRTRLTLWNAAIFALALTLIGAVVYMTTRQNLYGAVDSDLTVRAEFLERSWGHGFPGIGDHGPFGHRAFDSSPHDLGRHSPGPIDRGPRDDARPQLDAVVHDGLDPRLPGSHLVDGERNSTSSGDQKPPSIADPMTREASFFANLRGLDPIEAKRLEFSEAISRPRIFRQDGQHMGPPGETPFDQAGLSNALLGRRSVNDLDILGHRVRIMSVPLYEKGKIQAGAQFAANLDDVDAVIARLRRILLALLPLALLVTTSLGIWLTNRALRPVQEISEAAEQMEATNLSGRLPIRGDDEFARLSSRFNSMLNRIESAFKRQEDAYDAQRRFIADASHELKTPLTIVKGRVGVALARPQTPERYVDHLGAIGRASDRMASIIQDLLLLARSDENQLRIQPKLVPFEIVVSEALVGVNGDSGRIATNYPEGMSILCDPDMMARAIGNLLNNAARHTSLDGAISVSVRSNEGATIIVVEDSGEGIPPDHLNQVFERFHRVDGSRDRESGGTGLGLSIVKSIVEAHKGTIDIASEVGVGTRITITIPL